MKASVRKITGSFRARLILLVLLAAIPAFALTLHRNLHQRQSDKAQMVQEISAASSLISGNEQSYVRNTKQLLATLCGFEFLVNTTNAGFSRVHFANLLKLTPDYVNFGLIEANGTVFASGIMHREAVSLADRSYFKRAFANGKFSIGTYQVGRLSKEPSLNFGYPITNANGQICRIIFASLKIARLTEVARSVKLPEEGVATIIDSAGNILARLPTDGGWVGRALPDSALVQSVLKKKSGVIESRGLDMVERVYAITPISDDVSEQLFVTVGVPKKVLFARANRSLQRNVLIMLIILTAALLLASVFAERLLIQPITALSATANQLAKGDFSTRSNITPSTNELRCLSEAFDSMAQSLQQREHELRHANSAITRINAELEQRVTYRTAQLVAANQELEAFSYSVSHDLRAPLRHMDGFAELLQRKQAEKLDEKGRRHLQMIIDAARQMGALIDDLLTFSRMGRQELRTSSVNMNILVREAIEEQREVIGSRCLQWNVEELPAVEGDPALLKQVWINLISNAVKYSRPREETVISVGGKKNGPEHVFYVRDNGVGFDTRYADKLFGVFQRLHNESEFEGTGVGLANVKRIVGRHGGNVWAESKLGEGSVFYFSLSQTA